MSSDKGFVWLINTRTNSLGYVLSIPPENGTPVDPSPKLRFGLHPRGVNRPSVGEEMGPSNPVSNPNRCPPVQRTPFSPPPTSLQCVKQNTSRWSRDVRWVKDVQGSRRNSLSVDTVSKLTRRRSSGSPVESGNVQTRKDGGQDVGSITIGVGSGLVRVHRKFVDLWVFVPCMTLTIKVFPTMFSTHCPHDVMFRGGGRWTTEDSFPHTHVAPRTDPPANSTHPNLGPKMVRPHRVGVGDRDLSERQT